MRFFINTVYTVANSSILHDLHNHTHDTYQNTIVDEDEINMMINDIYDYFDSNVDKYPRFKKRLEHVPFKLSSYPKNAWNIWVYFNMEGEQGKHVMAICLSRIKETTKTIQL